MVQKLFVWIVVLAALTGLLCLSGAAAEVDVAVNVAAVGNKEFATLADAFAAYNADEDAQSIRLLADVSVLDWDLSKDTVLDLYGFTVTANNTAGYKLLVKDSRTDDYTINDAYRYGSIPAGGNVTACEGYYQINEGENATFHRLDLELTHVNLKLESMGIYYTTKIGGDEKIQAMVSTFGVAVRLYHAPDDMSIFTASEKTLVSWDGGAWQTGKVTGDNSVLITGIMKDNAYSTKLNSQRAEIPVWAACYIITTEGQTVLGPACGYSLRDVVEAAQSNDAYKDQLTDMLGKYRGVMIDWNIPNVRGNTPTKILMIGQSHAQDSSWLVYEVLKSQMPDREFLVADVYAPTHLGEHIENIENNNAVYEYYEFTQSGTFAQTSNFTIYKAIKKHDWDLIVFNEATWQQASEAHHNDGDFQWLTDYVKENATAGYKFAYNATWAQPISATLYGEDRQSATDTFRTYYLEWFGGDRLRHFKQICRLINTYVETDPDYDLVFHSGTAIQYASETLLVPEADVTRTYELYRDYTHLADYGRLLVAYQWYAQIFGLDKLEEVKVDTIAKKMRTKELRNLDTTADLTITQVMKENIIKSVNYALKNPNVAPPQNRENPILEPLY